MAKEYLDFSGLSHYNEKVKATYIAKTEIDGSLSDYAKKSDIPTIATVDKAGIVKPDGTTIQITAEGVLSSPNQDLSTYALKSELPKAATQEAAGLVKPGTGLSVTDDGTLNASAQEVDLSNYVQTEAIQDMLTKTEAAADYATKTELDGYVEDSEIADMLTKTAAAAEYAKKADITAVYKPKGSIASEAFEGLNVADNLGNVYNVTDAFVTTDAFVEGPSASYPANTNIVVVQVEEEYKLDALSGLVDLSSYMKTADISAITNETIDGLFTEV